MSTHPWPAVRSVGRSRRTPWPSAHPDPAAAALAELSDAIAVDAPGEWADQAACRNDRTDRHWPTGAEDSPGYRRHAAIAKQVCAWCPVRADCLAHALSVGEDGGIWGGLTPAERDAIASRRRSRAS